MVWEYPSTHAYNDTNDYFRPDSKSQKNMSILLLLYLHLNKTYIALVVFKSITIFI